ncbi:sugar ABC transporter substrate-binding protein [Virgisporangium ochraceum]|uniref:Sugar ABC transporter substrate-binding protein n=1 Tax=Virgisporangium ochraceum TaxID=65505 RepID=A0A8J4EAL4_9ACTN|nr:sugar ABC transporter substrate-binding protein [Virgisporangium ochraceum]GIJ67826.1 sugar ABC transporter substrate-binding protein [Virgisporangium ochraceum]
MRRWKALFGAAVLLAGLTACGDDDSGGGDVTLDYTLWVDAQLPAYQACADAFHAKNPTITIRITQLAWDQYWTNLTTKVVSGEAPDVFTDSVAYYPQFLQSNQIVDLEPFVKRDKVDLSQYSNGLPELWVRDGKRYGLPKDWDAIALLYNRDMAAQAGVDPAALRNLTWNPADGGTFEDLVAKLTVDQNGKRGDEPGFDKTKVKTYGLVADLASGAIGQTSWGNFAVSNGWYYVDRNPWGTKFNYADPKFTETIAWFESLQDKGFSPKYEKQSTVGTDAVLESQKAAMGITGSWMAGYYLGSTVKQKYAFAPLPTGPAGRKSATNGLSDAIYAGTKHKEEAWQWVKYLASSECQDIVADKAVVFPAIRSSSDRALAAFGAKGQDVTVFVDQAKAQGGTFLLPITENSARVAEVVQGALDAVWLGQKDAAGALGAANTEVNALFK